MLWTVKKAARELGMEPYQVYYLVAMGQIEAIKIGKLWRLEPEAVEDYDKRHYDRKNRKSAGDFIYSGDSRFLFDTSQNYLPSHLSGEVARMERRRGQLVHSAGRSQKALLQKLKPVTQLELFTAQAI